MAFEPSQQDDSKHHLPPNDPNRDSSSTHSNSSSASPDKPVEPSAPSQPPDTPNGAAGGLDEEHEYPAMPTVILLFACLFLVAFLFALDRLIIATAIPVITDHFHSLNDVGWYASAYLLTASAFQLLMGRIYTFYDPKWVWLTNVFIFEVGSAICGAAPNSPVFILGRAVAGLGTCGIMSGAIVIIVYAVPLYKRPMYTGLFGAVFGVASVAGPLLGGLFTDKVSWRWCFYINLPLGGVAMAVIALFVHLPTPKRRHVTLREQINQLDPIGTAVFLPGVVCLLLALQWGGTTYPWSNWRIILLLVLFGVLMPIFIYIQYIKQETATVPPRIFKQRTVMAGMWFTFCVGGAMMTVVYFLPIWFQAIKDASPVKSGIMTLPLVLALVVGSIGAGILTRRIGYYVPWMYLSAVLMPIAIGLISTFTPTTNHPKWIGYQVFYGFGLGIGMQQANVGVQTVLSRKDVSTGAALIFFAQTLGGTIFVSIGNNIFDNKLASGVAGIPGLTNPAAVVKVGATDIRKVVPPSLLPRVLSSYNQALVDTFYVCVAVSCAASIGAAFMEWRSIKGRDKKTPNTPTPPATGVPPPAITEEAGDKGQEKRAIDDSGDTQIPADPPVADAEEKLRTGVDAV